MVYGTRDHVRTAPLLPQLGFFVFAGGGEDGQYQTRIRLDHRRAERAVRRHVVGGVDDSLQLEVEWLERDHAVTPAEGAMTAFAVRALLEVQRFLACRLAGQCDFASTGKRETRAAAVSLERRWITALLRRQHYAPECPGGGVQIIRFSHWFLQISLSIYLMKLW
ncbi:MAG TPA: hypothetical protein VF883_14355 [Thermoanaerobaculia bacterium]